ncbi:MAG: ABC transporter substrate-binding protein, partial [Chloroflexota bacterium]|nr:ABC transporter substrate-binding protein [Chloroflexota bacterium]
MTRPDIDRLVDQLRRGEISRRGFISRAAAIGLSGTAAGVLAGQAGAQDASPEASPVGSPASSPVAGEATRSITREEYNAALREEYAFEEPASTGGQVIHVDTSDITTVNPTLVVDVFSGLITGFVFESLAGGSVIDGTMVPGLADYWDISADGLTYTFHINENAMWHDGQPVTAEDVVFTFDSVVAEDSLSVRRSSVTGALASYRAIDDKTVELVAVDRLANFVADTAAQFGIVPKHIWEGIPFAEWGTAAGATGQDPAQVIGSGPFTFVEWVRNDHVTLTRNPDYWDTENAAVIDEFIYRVVADAAAAVQTL